MYQLRTLGADTIMPVILRELQYIMSTGRVDLAEAYALLNDTQAIYLSRAEGRTSLYYAELEPKIVALLIKYNLHWVLSQDKLRDYVFKFLAAAGFKNSSELFWLESDSEDSLTLNHYDMILLKAVLCSACEDVGVTDLTIGKESLTNKIYELAAVTTHLVEAHYKDSEVSDEQ